MIKKAQINSKHAFLYAILLIFASLQFLLELNFKWPYVSDSLFYKHNYYQFQGSTYQQAKEKVLKNHPIPWQDTIQQNIFSDEETYSKVYKTFTKRPFYPFVAKILNSLGISEYFSFAIPIFIAYAGIVLLNFHLCKLRLNNFLATISTLMLSSFSPFLWWATIFMTDAIGAFFWMLQIYLIFLYFTKSKGIYLKLYLATLVISLLNREQSTLMVPLILTLVLLLKNHKTIRKLAVNLFVITAVAVAIFMVSVILLKQQTVWGNIIYIQSQYYLNDTNFIFSETLIFYLTSVVNAHRIFLNHLIASPMQILILAFGLLGIANTINTTIRNVTSASILDLIMIASAFASYLIIFAVPDFAYRFFTPLIISLIYFALKFTAGYFSEELEANRAYPPAKLKK